MAHLQHVTPPRVRSAPVAQQKRVFVLCPPRSLSSVFIRCLSLVHNTEVVFDTHFFALAAEKSLRRMGKVVDYQADDLTDDDWRQAMAMAIGEDCSGVDVNFLKYSKIKNLLDNPNTEKDFILCKSIAGPIDNHYEFLPDKSSKYKYTILLRHPIKVFKSFRNALYKIVKQSHIENESTDPKNVSGLKTFDEFHFIRDAPEGYDFPGLLFKELYDVWMYVKKNLDPNPTVIDSDDLLSDPAGMLAKYCAAVGIAYSDDLLKWDGKPESTDDWKTALSPMHHFDHMHLVCGNMLYSTHFLPPNPLPSIDDVTDDIREGCEFVMPYYQEMYDARILP